MFKATVVFLALLGVAFAAVSWQSLEPTPKKFENVEGCYIPELDDMIPLGGAKPSKSSCQEYRCQETAVQIVSCGALAAAPPYCIVSDDSIPPKPYPGCCDKLVKCAQQED